MILLAANILAYASTVWILATYFLVQRGAPVRWLNWSNFIGAFPLGIVEIYAHVWAPLSITVSFGIIGLYGILVSGSRNHERLMWPINILPQCQPEEKGVRPEL